MKGLITIAFFLNLVLVLHADTKTNVSKNETKHRGLAEATNNAIDTNFRLYLKNREGNPMKALHYLQLALNVAQQNNKPDKIALINYHKGYLYRILGIHSLALQNYLKALTFYEKKDVENLLGWTLIDIGNLYFAEKINFSFALEHYEKAKSTFLASGDTVGVVVSEYCTGMVYKEKKEYDTALKYFSNAVILSRKVVEKNHLPFALTCLGQTYLLKNNPAEAQKHFDESFRISKAIDDKKGIALTHNSIAEASMLSGNLNNSISNYRMALSYLNAIPDKAGISQTLEKLSKVYDMQGNLQQAALLASQALSVADSFNIVNQQEALLPLVAGYFARLNETAKAYKSLQRYINIKQSGTSLSSRQIQVEYESQLRNHEASLLMEKHNKQKAIAYTAIAAFIVVGILLLLIYLKNKDLKSSYKYLYEKHIALSQKEEELSEIKKITKGRSPLKEDFHQGLLDQLTDLMQTEKVFLTKELSLDDLAKRLNTNRTYLSQFINDQFQSNFSNYVNEYRVKEARKILLQPAGKLLKIEAIAQDVGFNSKSSFNIAFKKFTGLTPSDFMAIRSET